jgi:ribosome biogenesis protein BMS1
MVINLQDAPDTLAAKLEESELAIFANSAPVKASDLAEKKTYGILKI